MPLRLQATEDDVYHLMRWVGLMNTLKAQAEEIIQDELIYK